MAESSGKNLATWRNDVSTIAQQHRPEKPFDGAVEVILKFYFLRPKSVSAKKRPYPCVKPDVDKITRAIFDAMKGRLPMMPWCATVVKKRYDDVPRVEVGEAGSLN